MGDRLFSKIKVVRAAAPGICRLCATIRKSDCFVHIRDPNLDLIAKLKRCCQLTIPENDHLPENVCTDCVRILRDCWSFAEKVREAQESLQALYNVEEIVVEETNEVDSFPIETVDESDLQDLFADSNITEDKPTKICLQRLKVKRERYTNDENFEEVLDDLAADNNDDEEYTIETEILNEDPGDSMDSNSNEVLTSTKIEGIESWRDYPWTCTQCKNVFSGVMDLRDHMEVAHGAAECTYICADCSKSYTKYYLFLNHVMTHRSHLKLFCDLCSDCCETAELMAQHREEHKNTDGVAFCSICLKAFKNVVSLYSHFRWHKQEQRFHCEVCGKRFGTKPNLKAHQKIHFGLKEFVCAQCGKGFIQKANLEEHAITHLNETPFECNECDKSFKTSARLAKHKGVHSSVRPHKCTECGKEFREKDTLRVHMRIHTGAMPYECEFCGKRFRFRSILVTHRHQHTGVRPYSCQECNHHFTNWPNYNKHMKRRHGVSGSTKATTSATSKQKKVTTNRTVVDLESDLLSVASTVSFHSYSVPESDTQTSELANFFGLNNAKDAERESGPCDEDSGRLQGDGTSSSLTASVAVSER